MEVDVQMSMCTILPEAIFDAQKTGADTMGARPRLVMSLRISASQPTRYLREPGLLN